MTDEQHDNTTNSIKNSHIARTRKNTFIYSDALSSDFGNFADHRFGIAESKDPKKESTILEKAIRKGFRRHYDGVEAEKKMDQIDELDKEYLKTEYNCQKAHHHNPGTMMKINSLLSG